MKKVQWTDGFITYHQFIYDYGRNLSSATVVVNWIKGSFSQLTYFLRFKTDVWHPWNRVACIIANDDIVLTYLFLFTKQYIFLSQNVIDAWICLLHIQLSFWRAMLCEPMEIKCTIPKIQLSLVLHKRTSIKYYYFPLCDIDNVIRLNITRHLYLFFSVHIRSQLFGRTFSIQINHEFNADTQNIPFMYDKIRMMMQ